MSKRLDWDRTRGEKKVLHSLRMEPPFNPDEVRWFFNDSEYDRVYLYKPVSYVWKRDRALCLLHHDPNFKGSKYDPVYQFNKLITFYLEQEELNTKPQLEKIPVDLADWLLQVPKQRLLDIFWSTLTHEQRRKWIEAYQEENDDQPR